MSVCPAAAAAAAGVEHWNKDAPGSPHYVPVLFATYAVGLLLAYMAGAAVILSAWQVIYEAAVSTCLGYKHPLQTHSMTLVQ
jgi:hypothetical protein